MHSRRLSPKSKRPRSRSEALWETCFTNEMAGPATWLHEASSAYSGKETLFPANGSTDFQK
jgi:hypothetical protein